MQDVCLDIQHKEGNIKIRLFGRNWEKKCYFINGRQDRWN